MADSDEFTFKQNGIIEKFYVSGSCRPLEAPWGLTSFHWTGSSQTRLSRAPDFHAGWLATSGTRRHTIRRILRRRRQLRNLSSVLRRTLLSALAAVSKASASATSTSITSITVTSWNIAREAATKLIFWPQFSDENGLWPFCTLKVMSCLAPDSWFLIHLRRLRKSEHWVRNLATVWIWVKTDSGLSSCWSSLSMY